MESEEGREVEKSEEGRWRRVRKGGRWRGGEGEGNRDDQKDL